MTVRLYNTVAADNTNVGFSIPLPDGYICKKVTLTHHNAESSSPRLYIRGAFYVNGRLVARQNTSKDCVAIGEVFTSDPGVTTISADFPGNNIYNKSNSIEFDYLIERQ